MNVVVQVTAPVAVARTGRYGTSIEVSPALTVFAVQLPCVICSDPLCTWMIARPGCVCQPESKSTADLRITWKWMLVPSASIAVWKTPDAAIAVTTAALTTMHATAHPFFERRNCIVPPFLIGRRFAAATLRLGWASCQASQTCPLGDFP